MMLDLEIDEDIPSLELQLTVKDALDGAPRKLQPGGGPIQAVKRSDRIRIVPPPGVDSAQITHIDLLAKRESGECYRYSRSKVDWPSGTHQSATATFVSPPRITGLSPAQGPTTGGTRIELKGEGFTADMEILWDGAPLPSAVVQDSRTAAVDSAKSGAWKPGQAIPVAVRDPVGCQTNEATQRFQPYAATVDFQSTAIPLSKMGEDLRPVDVRAGYINDDNRLDITVASTAASGGYVTILFADSTYQFSQTSNRCDLATNGSPSSLATGFFTHPKRSIQDIAAASVNMTNKRLSIFRGSTADSANCLMFQSESLDISTKLSQPQSVPFYVISRDLNKDRLDDIIITADLSKSVVSYISNLRGGYDLNRVDIDDGDNGSRRGASFADANGDGFEDVLLANYGGYVEVLKTTETIDISNPANKSYALQLEKNIQFKPIKDRSNMLIAAYPTSVLLRPSGTPGSVELLISRPKHPSVGILRCPTGLLSCPDSADSGLQTLDVGVDPEPLDQYIVQADFNGDGFMDVALSNLADKTVHVFIANQQGQLVDSPRKIHQSGCNLARLEAQDLNADGKPDLIVVGQGGGCGGGLGSVIVLRNTSN